MIANILQEIQQYQNTPYCLKPESTIQEFLKSHDVQGDIPHNQWEDILYDQSVDIEPRDQPAKKCVCLSIYLSIYLSIHPSNPRIYHLFIYLSIHLSIHPSNPCIYHLFIYL